MKEQKTLNMKGCTIVRVIVLSIEKERKKKKKSYYYYLSLWPKIFVIVPNAIHRVAFNKIMAFIKIHNITVR